MNHLVYYYLKLPRISELEAEKIDYWHVSSSGSGES